MKKCCICGCEFEEWGNNPYPVRTGLDDTCCDDCNSGYVIPFRVMMMGADQDRKKEIADKLNTMSLTELNNLLKIF